MDCNSEPLEARKKQKIRSAWISFAGRIAAQLIGAAATVGLGVIVLGNRVPAATAATTAAASSPSVLVAKHVRTQQGTVIVLVPLDRYAEVTTETVERVSHALATNVSQTVEVAMGSDPSETPAQGQTPRWVAANAH